jgi:thymidylate synthase (FAD)
LVEVELIDYTSDGISKIARMARATRKNKIEKPEYCIDKEKNEKFVKALIKVKHLGILEHINFTFHVSEVSRALSHQLVRHRIGFSYLQMSSRHAKPEEKGYITPPTMKLENLSTEKHMIVSELFNNNIEMIYRAYEELINLDIPIEDARYVLPPAFFTHISFTVNLRAARHFLELRLDNSAQWEIATLALRMYDIIYNIYPVCLEDLKDKRDKCYERLHKIGQV